MKVKEVIAVNNHIEVDEDWSESYKKTLKGLLELSPEQKARVNNYDGLVEHIKKLIENRKSG